MTFVLIHDRGRTRKIEQRPYEDRTVSKPAMHQRPKGFWTMWREWRMPKAHNGYKPGFVFDLGADQCRFIEGEDHVMCGAQIQEGSSYCPVHHTRTRRLKPNDQRQD